VRSIKRICDVEFDTGCEIFDAGARKVIVKLCDRGIRVRGARQNAWRFVSWQKLYDIGQQLAADFDAGPRKGRLHRGHI
jgi:hypothetical protein